MTKLKQDINQAFYSGNTKIIKVTIEDADDIDDQLKDLENAELTYVVTERTDYTRVILRKSSHKGESEVKITGKGTCEIYLYPSDTINIYGTFRHHLNVVDKYNKEATVLVGMVRIHQNSAQRYRERALSAHLEGV